MGLSGPVVVVGVVVVVTPKNYSSLARSPLLCRGRRECKKCNHVCFPLLFYLCCRLLHNIFEEEFSIQLFRYLCHWFVLPFWVKTICCKTDSGQFRQIHRGGMPEARANFALPKFRVSRSYCLSGPKSQLSYIWFSAPKEEDRPRYFLSQLRH